MPPTVQIAWRFISSRKRAMGMTLAGIVFGVGFFIVTQAQTSGFQAFFVRTILGTKGAIRIEDRFQDTMDAAVARGAGNEGFIIESDIASHYVEGVDHPDLLREALLDYDEVVGVSEIIRGRGTATTGFREQSVRLLGIRLQDHLAVTDLAEQIVAGSLEDFAVEPGTLVIGRKLSERLNAGVGDYVTIESGRERGRYQLAAIFETGVSDIDRQFVYMDIMEARSLLRRPFGGAHLQIDVRNPGRAPDLAVQMRNHLNHHAMSWQEREKAWLDVFKALRLSSAITVSTIILLSGLGMFNTLAMMVMVKSPFSVQWAIRSGIFRRCLSGRAFLSSLPGCWLAGPLAHWRPGPSHESPCAFVGFLRPIILSSTGTGLTTLQLAS